MLMPTAFWRARVSWCDFFCCIHTHEKQSVISVKTSTLEVFQKCLWQNGVYGEGFGSCWTLQKKKLSQCFLASQTDVTPARDIKNSVYVCISRTTGLWYWWPASFNVITARHSWMLRHLQLLKKILRSNDYWNKCKLSFSLRLGNETTPVVHAFQQCRNNMFLRVRMEEVQEKCQAA